MDLTNSIVLSTYFVDYVLFITLIGIFFVEYFRRAGSNKKMLLSFLLLSIAGLCYVVLSTYRSFFGSASEFYFFATSAFLVFLIIIFLVLDYELWKHKIHKKLLVFFQFFVLIYFVFEIIQSLHRQNIFKVIIGLNLMTVVVIYYILLVKFLIDTSKK